MKKIYSIVILMLLFQSSYGRPYHGFQISNKYNNNFKSYLKKKDLEKYNNISSLKSIDKVILSKNEIVQSYVNIYTKPELISPKLCLIKSFYHNKTSELTWDLEFKSNLRYFAVIKPKQKCPNIMLKSISLGGLLFPSNYTSLPENVSSKEILRLVKSKTEIQKQAKWPTQFNNFSFKKNRKPQLDNLESINYNKAKNQYNLQYSCVGGCSCLGSLVFTVKWTNNKFYKVVNVGNQYRGCI